jgi:leucyl-tRNA synthetase
VDFTPRGMPPLASNKKWLNVKCSKCGGPAKRDAETLDTFFDSSWYFWRYLDPKHDKGPFDKLKAKILTPVDIYFGGAEHTLGHTLYARFFTKFFQDIGLIDYDEFALKRMQHGIVLGPDGNKMSKSKGNVINPDEVVKEYGADTARMYLCFMMPYEGTGPWSDQTIAGVNRFLKRGWGIYQNGKWIIENGKEDKKLVVKLNKTIKKVMEDIEEIKMNTAIAAMMEFVNEWEAVANFQSSSKSQISKNPLSVENAKKFLQILAPFAPFMTEEIWHSVFGEKESIHISKWPDVNKEALIEDEIEIPVQVNGKLRTTIRIKNQPVRNATQSVAGGVLSSKKEVEKIAIANPDVKKYLEGKKYKMIYVPGKIVNFVIV